MIYGVHLSAQGVMQQSTQLDVVANNLANASTTGFKRQLAVFRGHPTHDLSRGKTGDDPPNWNQHSGGISTSAIATDYSTGPLIATGRDLDVALAGQGFFRVADAGGQQFLTRDGRMVVNENLQVVTAGAGHQVLQAGGAPLALPADFQTVMISAAGEISVRTAAGEDIPVGLLDIVQPQSTDQIEKLGDGIYRFQGPLAPAGPDVVVKQGHLEGSGTRPMVEMMKMIESTRAIENNINMIKFQDETLSQLLQMSR
ncbi:MAG: flagellar hook basal-body protein [Planctomycetaceae bacterium]